ncbi:class I SAM-dependent DNA methyltransferase [Nocardia sp. NBC_01388]|uniref:HsdM family class I SAM-dependent methyltransferase n=1 Tax=Nocardia sp. NBC_01388 TaxID=2903596 RepID=UPI003250164F
MSDEGTAPAPVVTAAQIARLAGVTRAAVANWRRRHDDFPAPVGGTAAGPLFSLSAVETWLAGQLKGRGVSPEVALWQSMRSAHGDDLAAALVRIGSTLSEGEIQSGALPDEMSNIIDRLVSERSAPQLFEDLISRYVASVGRSGAQAVSSPRLIRVFVHFAGLVDGSVYDPSCGIGSVLLAVQGPRTTLLAGQDINPDQMRLARLRAGFTDGLKTRLETGNSLRNDRLPDLRAQLVVCDPPSGQPDWGREDLLLDPRWELGVPPRAESDLAWLQHCYFHTAPGGRTLIALPPSAAYRRSGRRIRSELVRRGILVSVTALPAGMAASHNLPLLLWELRRPAMPGDEVRSVRMVDLTANDPDGSLDSAPDQSADVPLINLLGEDVDLSPTTYVTAAPPDYPSEYAVLRTALERQLRELAALLPTLPPGPGLGKTDELPVVDVSDLVQAGLVGTEGPEAISTSDQLDTDYLRGFLRSANNTRRTTSSTGTYRADLRGAQLPQMDIEQQRRYGGVFRELGEFERRIQEVAKMSDKAARLAYDGLTNGALAPDAIREGGK